MTGNIRTAMCITLGRWEKALYAGARSGPMDFEDRGIWCAVVDPFVEDTASSIVQYIASACTGVTTIAVATCDMAKRIRG
jgi:hypothetical protein